MADKKDPIGSVTKKKPAVVEILDPKKGDLYKAMDTSDENLRKSSEYKLALWTESIEEARDQAKLMNLRRATGRPKVSKDPENPQSGREWAMPKHEEPGTPVKQNHDYKIPKPKLDAYSKGQKTRFLIEVNAKRVNPRPENKLKMDIYRMPITAVDSLVCMCLARDANKELAGKFFPNLEAAPKKEKSAAKKKEKKSPKETAPAPEAAAPSDPEEAFSQRAKRALATALGLSMEEMPDPDGKGSHLPDEDWVGSGEVASWGGLTQDAGPRDYVVYDSMETAEDVAKAAVLNDLQDEPELFNQDWLLNQIPTDDIEAHFEPMVRESFESYIEDMGGHELERELEDGGFEDKEEFINHLTEEAMKDDHGMGWFRDNIGADELNKELSDALLPYLGTDALRQIAAQAVNEDGAGHFISGWDGELNELEGGMVYAMW